MQVICINDDWGEFSLNDPQIDDIVLVVAEVDDDYYLIQEGGGNKKYLKSHFEEVIERRVPRIITIPEINFDNYEN